MSDVKWIKLSTHMFDDEKIRVIEQMPEADTILIIWVKLLSQAGKTNASGYIYLAENIPYTEEMLAAVFNRPVNVVRMALKTFESFGMISIDQENYIEICNWEKHQNVEGLDKIREQTRKRVAKHRKKQRIETNKDSNDTGNDDVTLRNATDKELELDKELDKEKDKENNVVAVIVSFWDNNGFGFNNIQAKESLLKWLDDSNFKEPGDMIIKALEIASASNIRNLRYVEGILKNWENSNILTVEEIESNGKKPKKEAEKKDKYEDMYDDMDF
ncbi:phage replisome organizer, putative, N-terminal region [Halolactibacillus halophilus]|uniref:Phage replisome organizer, putative, N-terminal region n=1 Tax=Halolactibacillus halophilus TaxID=306540 RepID=A0A1I5S5B1_9BACI|nr:phage replisome organizer N-terminal domain-containing protein [Halolactibacillus halophilus]GEM02924.1 hypothetical protein HHA03_24560 [Halolactibacillus halophilus]SFP65811.1 phage replisome organizer, putative, N-terminal region [Halolactibacillus halophilus]